MKIGYPSVFYLSGKPVTLQEETSLILVHAYRLAYQDYFRDSIGQKFSRFFHVAKPKRVSVVSRVIYKLKAVPFGTKEVLVSDSCSSCTEKVEIVSLNPTHLSDSSKNLRISANTNDEQSEFIRQLKATSIITASFQKRSSSSPFLIGSSALMKDAISCLHNLGEQDENSPAIKSEHEAADNPEKLRDALSVFLESREGFVIGLNQSRQRIAESSQLMTTAIQRRYPIKQNELKSVAEFGWKVPGAKPDGWEKLLHPADGLIEGLQLEVKPEIDNIERESRIEKERVEQAASLERRRIDQTYKVELSNIRRDKELSLKRLESQENSLESQVKLLKSQHKDAEDAYEEAQDDYEESTVSGSVQTSGKLREKVDRLERNERDLAQKLDDAEQALETVESEISDTTEDFDQTIKRVEHNQSLALDDNEAKLRTTIGAVEEKRRRSVNDKLTNVVLVQGERGVLEEIANRSLIYDKENLEASETVKYRICGTTRPCCTKRRGLSRASKRPYSNG